MVMTVMMIIINTTYQNEFKCQKNKKRSKARIIRSIGFNKMADPENIYYRELIMLFTSWRNENIDLIGNCSSYQEHYLLLKGQIDEQMKLYSVCSQDLNEIEENLSSMEENGNNYDLIAPNTQNIELQDEAEGAQDLHPDLTERYDLSEDIGIPSTAANTDQLTGILNEAPDDLNLLMDIPHLFIRNKKVNDLGVLKTKTPKAP